MKEAPRPTPATRITHYRCFLPDLAGLRAIVAGERRSHHRLLAVAIASLGTLRWEYRKTGGEGRDSNPEAGIMPAYTHFPFVPFTTVQLRTRLRMTHRSGLVSGPWPHPRSVFSPGARAFGCPKFRRDELSNAIGDKAVTPFSGVLLNSTTRTPLP